MSTKRAAHLRRQLSVDYPRYPPQNSLTQQPPPSTQAAQPISDYESDNQGYVSDIPAKAPPPTRTIEELNLSVLQRHNPAVAHVLSIVAYAVVYEFSPIPEPTWSKTGVEGSMFICQLTSGLFGEDRYNVIILNRRGLNNFEIELREADDGGVEISDPYVIISCKEDYEQKIYGVFIFSEGAGSSTEQQRAANANLMKTLAVSASTSKKAAEAAAANAVAQHHDGHVQEAVSSLNNVPVSDRQVNLLGLFGQQHGNKGDESGRAYSSAPVSGQYQHLSPSQHGNVYPGQGADQAPQQDILADLFRRAGLK